MTQRRIALTLDEAKSLLGFRPSDRPTPDQVAKAYRTQVRKSHPDLGGSAETMVALNVAKEVLDGKSRPDFKLKGPSEADQGLAKDVRRIEQALKIVSDTLANNDLVAFEFKGYEPFHVFLQDQYADVLELIHDSAEKSLRKPESDEDAKALSEIEALSESMESDTLRLISVYKALNMSPTSTAAGLQRRYELAEKVVERFNKLVLKSKKLVSLLNLGIGPKRDDAVSIAYFIVSRYMSEGHEGLISYQKLIKEPKDSGKVEGTLSKAILEVLDILHERGINLSDWDLSEKWQHWDVPESFELAMEAIEQMKSRTASAARVASRAAK